MGQKKRGVIPAFFFYASRTLGIGGEIMKKTGISGIDLQRSDYFVTFARY